MKINLHCKSFWSFIFFKSKKSNLSLNNKNLKWGEISLWNRCFSLIHIGHNVFTSLTALHFGWKIQTWPIIRFLTGSVTYLFFYLLVFDRIHDAMCLNKMSRTSSRNIGPQHTKIQQYISLYTWGTFNLKVHGVPLNPSWVFAAKKRFFLFHLTKEASPIWSSSRVCFWMS